MNKNTLFVLTSLLLINMLIFVGTGTTGTTGTTDNSEEQKGVIKVYGESEISAKPDFARAVLGVETTSKDVKEAVQKNADKMDSVVAALKDSGVDKDNIKTGAYRVNQYREQEINSNEYTDRYRTSNQVKLILFNTDDVGNVIDIAVKAGSNRVQSVSFELEDQESLKLDALQLATKQARNKGEAIAESADTQIESIKYISEEISSYSPYRAEYGMEARDMITGEAAETPIVPGNIKVQARVMAEYFLIK